MSNIDQAIEELVKIESDHEKERRIRWIDNGLQVFWIVSWVSFWFVWRPPRVPSFTNSQWIDSLVILAVFIGLGFANFGLKLILDRLFKTGRRSSFREYLASFAISTIVVVIIVTILIFAASKTADLLF